MNENVKEIVDKKVLCWDDSVLDKFMGKRVAGWRYASFDYCYNHFYKMDNIEDLEKSCAILWSYLSSWGMIRGTTTLLQQNYYYLKDMINYIAFCGEKNPGYWDIDFPYDNEKSIKTLITMYNDIEVKLAFTAQRNSGKQNTNPSNTLVTKTMLGVFGVVPAFDDYVSKFFNYLVPKRQGKTAIKNEGVNEKTCEVLNRIGGLKGFTIPKLDNLLKRSEFDTLSFDSRGSNRKYTRAKLVDMYCFIVGQELAEAEKI